MRGRSWPLFRRKFFAFVSKSDREATTDSIAATIFQVDRQPSDQLDGLVAAAHVSDPTTPTSSGSWCGVSRTAKKNGGDVDLRACETANSPSGASSPSL